MTRRITLLAASALMAATLGLSSFVAAQSVCVTYQGTCVAGMACVARPSGSSASSGLATTDAGPAAAVSMWAVALKSWRLSLRNGWFLGTWAVAAVLAAAAVWVSWIEYEERVGLFDAARTSNEAEVGRAGAYSQLELGLERPPTPLSLLSRGVGERLGSSALIPGRYGETALSRRDRPVAESARRLNLDLAWVLALVVGFASVFFGHGMINGERLGGTLKQQLAKGLPRSKLLIGEYVGGLLAVVLPCALVLVGFAAWVVVCARSGRLCGLGCRSGGLSWAARTG